MSDHLADFDPVEAALQRSPWCLLVPTGDPDDPDIIGPFSSREEARIWSLTCPGAVVLKMGSPEFEVLWGRQLEEIETRKRPNN